MNMKVTLENVDHRAIAQEVANLLEQTLSYQNRSEQMFNVGELAAYINVSKDWVYKKVTERAIPFTKIGKYNRFKKSDIDQWLTNSTNQPATAESVQ